MHSNNIKVNVITDNFYLYHGICMLLKKSYKTSNYIVELCDLNDLRTADFCKEELFIFDVDSLRDSFLRFFEHGYKSFFIVSGKNQRVFREGFKADIDTSLDEFRKRLMKFITLKAIQNGYDPIFCFSSKNKSKRLNSLDKEIILRTLQGQNINEISGTMRKKLKTTYGHRTKSLEKLGVSSIHGLHSVQHVVLGLLLK